jgi:hypothetical protein
MSISLHMRFLSLQLPYAIRFGSWVSLKSAFEIPMLCSADRSSKAARRPRAARPGGAAGHQAPGHSIISA